MQRGWRWAAALCLCLLLTVGGGAVPGTPLSMESRAEESRLVIEVVEEIPADSLVEIEDEEVPLAGSIRPRRDYRLPAAILLAAGALAGYEMIRNRHRNALFKQRRDGYREEAKRLEEVRRLMERGGTQA